MPINTREKLELMSASSACRSCNVRKLTTTLVVNMPSSCDWRWNRLRRWTGDRTHSSLRAHRHRTPPPPRHRQLGQ